APPASFAADYQGGITSLAWNPNSESDLWYYRLHRDNAVNFVPTAGNLVANTSETTYDDSGPWGGYYKLAAVDINGNVGGYSLVTPQSTTGAPIEDSAAALALAIRTQGPNPARSGRLVVHVSLPSNAPATLELLDVTGRRVFSQEVGGLGAGEHTVSMAGDRNMAAGVYLVRLNQGEGTRVTRFTLVP
ncbi:MAG: hypothetical protein FD129_1248, partial [bacterium]